MKIENLEAHYKSIKEKFPMLRNVSLKDIPDILPILIISRGLYTKDICQKQLKHWVNNDKDFNFLWDLLKLYYKDQFKDKFQLEIEPDNDDELCAYFLLYYFCKYPSDNNIHRLDKNLQHWITSILVQIN